MVLPRCNGNRANFDQHKLKVMTHYASDTVYTGKHSPPPFALDDNGRILRLSENKTAFKLLC